MLKEECEILESMTHQTSFLSVEIVTDSLSSLFIRLTTHLSDSQEIYLHKTLLWLDIKFTSDLMLLKIIIGVCLSDLQPICL